MLDDIPALAVTEEQAAAIRQGRSVKLLRTGGPEARESEDVSASLELSDGTVVCAMAGTTLVALARYHAGMIQPMRVLQL